MSLCDQQTFNLHDDNIIDKCPKCKGCPSEWTSKAGYPVSAFSDNSNYYCVIVSTKCEMSYNFTNHGQNPAGGKNKDPIEKYADHIKAATTAPVQNPPKTQAKSQPEKNVAKQQQPAKTNTNTNTNTNTKVNASANANTNASANTNANANTNKSNANSGTTNNKTGVNMQSVVASNYGDASAKSPKPAESLTGGSQTMANEGNDTDNVAVSNVAEEDPFPESYVPEPEFTSHTGDGENPILSKLENGARIEDGKGGVSPILVGSLSLFTVLFILVGFVYIRKRKHDKDEDLDLIYRNSIFYATPIVEKNFSQNSNKSNKTNKSNGSIGSNGSKYNLQANQTAISSNDDGVYDIIISPTPAATVNKSQTVQSGKSLGTLNEESSVMPNNSLVEADEGVFSEEESLLRNASVSNSYNNLNRIDSAKVTEAIASAYMSPEILATPPSKNTSISNRSLEERVTPLPPAAVLSPKVAVQNAHLVYEANDISVHEPNLSFMNSTNNISFINNNVKEDSYMISNYYEMNHENSINQDSRLMYSPTFNTSTIKRSLSMVLSEYKEDSFYNAKFNYEPSMEDEMKISINDRVLVKEIFNDGWAYGENKTTEACGIFPINRLDSTTSN